MKWPRLLTEPDNITPCPVRIGGFTVMVAYHLFMVWIIFKGGTLTFEKLSDYTQNMALLIGVVGGTMGAKSILRGDSQHNDQ